MGPDNVIQVREMKLGMEKTDRWVNLRSEWQQRGIIPQGLSQVLPPGTVLRHLTCTISCHPLSYPEIVSEDEIEI